jgi:hypothetical protein
MCGTRISVFPFWRATMTATSGYSHEPPRPSAYRYRPARSCQGNRSIRISFACSWSSRHATGPATGGATAASRRAERPVAGAGLRPRRRRVTGQPSRCSRSRRSATARAGGATTRADPRRRLPALLAARLRVVARLRERLPVGPRPGRAAEPNAARCGRRRSRGRRSRDVRHRRAARMHPEERAANPAPARRLVQRLEVALVPRGNPGRVRAGVRGGARDRALAYRGVLVTTPGSPPSGAVTTVPMGRRGAFTGVDALADDQPEDRDDEGVDQRDLLGRQVQAERDGEVDRDGDDRGDRRRLASEDHGSRASGRG